MLSSSNWLWKASFAFVLISILGINMLSANAQGYFRRHYYNGGYGSGTVIPANYYPIGHESVQDKLGGKVDSDNAQMQQDAVDVKQDEQAYSKDTTQMQQYIDQGKQWEQQIDPITAQKKAQLKELEVQVKSPAVLKKMLNTPGSDMYVLNSWLKNESGQRAQVESNIARAQQRIASDQSVINQNKIHVADEQALVQHDQNDYYNHLDDHPYAPRSQNQNSVLPPKYLYHQ